MKNLIVIILITPITLLAQESDFGNWIIYLEALIYKQDYLSTLEQKVCNINDYSIKNTNQNNLGSL
jgi:hypothetical protein